MAELPPVIGRYQRNPVVIIVTGRTALARVGGLTAVGRNATTARRLGLDPVVLYPSSMPALGAEIAGEVDSTVACLPADAFSDQAGGEDDEVLVIAGDWFIAPPAIMDFSERTRGDAVARFDDRGRLVAPLARMRVKQVRSFLGGLATHPTGTLIAEASHDNAEVFPLSVRVRHRLSDSVAIQRCEDKLFAMLGTRHEPAHVRLVEKHLAIPIARRLARTSLQPIHAAMLQIALTYLAARVFGAGGYTAGVAGALVFAVSRIAESVAADLARAAVREGVQDRAPIVFLDVLGQIAILWSIAFATAAIEYAPILAAIATLGLVASTWMTVHRVLKPIWIARATQSRHHVPPDNFAARFLRRNGAAWGLLLTALVGRLDLFLWAAAIGSHLFYLMWLRVDARERDRAE